MNPKAARSTWPVLALVVVAVGAIVTGLVVTGGPAQGRKERRDELRLADLQALARLVQCLAGESGALPTDLAATAQCAGDLRRADPHSGTPYRFEALSSDSFRFCATFETDLPLRTHWSQVNIDAAAGCITSHLPRPAAAK